jgi:hypothetical protein
MIPLSEETPWLTWLGKEELRLVKEFGWEHPAVIQAQQRFRDGYLAVKAIRKAYESPSSEENHD